MVYPSMYEISPRIDKNQDLAAPLLGMKSKTEGLNNIKAKDVRIKIYIGKITTYETN